MKRRLKWEDVVEGAAVTLWWREYGSMSKGESYWREAVSGVIDEVCADDINEDGSVRGVYITIDREPFDLASEIKESGFRAPKRWRMFFRKGSKGPGVMYTFHPGHRDTGIANAEFDAHLDEPGDDPRSSLDAGADDL